MINITHSPRLILGSGRSGTTWILDALAEANNLRTIFEPLFPIGVPEAKPFANRYIEDNAYNPELRQFMNDVFSGKVGGIWVKYRERPDRLRPSIDNLTSLHHNYDQVVRYKKVWERYREYRKVKSDRLIIKFIRANLMIGWLTNNCDVNLILVVRHPVSVISSKIRMPEKYRTLDWDFDGPLKIYRGDRNFYRHYLHAYDHVFQHKQTPLSAYTILWCIENVLPIIKAQEQGHCVIFYEDLLINPEEEWARIITALDLRKTPSRHLIHRPSQQTYGEMKNRTFGRSQLTKWMNDFKKQELREIENVLNIFNVTVYSAFDPMPISHIQAEV